MLEQSIKTEQGTLYYIEEEAQIFITSYSGRDSVLVVPDTIEGKPVVCIKKKAFMNSRQLQRLILPDSIETIEEWAFAYCSLLKEVELPRKRMTLGTGVYLGLQELKGIVLRGLRESAGEANGFSEDMATLLATVPIMKDGEYLLDMEQAGSDEWIDKWDSRLLKILSEPDEKDFTNMILCGEEDINCTIERFTMDKRKQKVRFCFLRLLHSSGLAPDTKTILEDYLISHSLGQENPETWLVLKEERGHERAYYELYVQLGCLNQDNYEATIADLKEQHPEMKAYFIRWNQDSQGNSGDAFDAFVL